MRGGAGCGLNCNLRGGLRAQISSLSRYGTHIITQLSSTSVPQPTLSPKQLLMFNSSPCRREGVSACDIKHNQERETPLPIHLGVMVHTKIHRRDLVDTLCVVHQYKWGQKATLVSWIQKT